jgi:pentose-5-phosphate-3-epimerase
MNGVVPNGQGCWVHPVLQARVNLITFASEGEDALATILQSLTRCGMRVGTRIRHRFTIL